MQIIVRGKVIGKMFEVKRLIDSKGLVIARLFGDWAENYGGCELGIVALDEEHNEPVFEMMARILNGKEEEHEVALSDPLHDQELEERDE